MERYAIKQRIGNKGWVIWDSKLSKFLGDGKEGLATSETYDNALTVVSTMAQRVGA